jgi:SSS family solute:Na+ symporter
LAHISDVHGTSAPLIPYWLGCAVVAVVVTLGVFLGGMRGTVWVNIVQTTLFLCFGAVAVLTISHSLPGGFGEYISKLAGDPKTSFLVTREKMPAQAFWSYTLIPLSSIMFPHMAIMCFSARKVTAFRRTVVLYPLAILLIWLPCVFLGVLGFATLGKVGDPDGILLLMLEKYAPEWLAGILGAGIISAVMGSDAHQILALSTMFTKDIYQHYGGREKYGEKGAVYFARGFIIIITLIAYLIALSLKEKQGIFEIAVRYAFSGFAALAPVMVGALFWKRSTKWGALASTLFTAACLIYFAILQNAGKPGDVIWQLGQGKDTVKVLFINPRGDVSFWNGFMTVVPMVFGSALCMVLGSLVTRPPGQQTIRRYFSAAVPKGAGSHSSAPVESH